MARQWVSPYHEAYRQQVQAALNELTALPSTEHEYTAAIVCAQRLLQLDPLQEDTYRTLYRTLMELHLQADNRALAVRVYHACVEQLQTGLGVEPSA